MTVPGTYDYAGFSFVVNRTPSPRGEHVYLTAAPGQHKAAYKAKHLKAATERFLTESSSDPEGYDREAWSQEQYDFDRTRGELLMTSNDKIIPMDLSAIEARIISLARTCILGYVKERTRVSSRHKLPTFDEIADTKALQFVIGTGTYARRILRVLLDQLVSEGEIVEDGPYFGTERKEVL